MMAGGSVSGVGLTLDDLRQPELKGRVWGYDRGEVDQLLAVVITSIERLQSRRERDAAALGRATDEATEARAWAERAERERDDVATRLELALHQAPVDQGGGRADDARSERDDREALAAATALDEARRLVAQAEERAGRAERQILVLREEMAVQRARTRRLDLAETEVGDLQKELSRASERVRRAEAAPAGSAYAAAARPPGSPSATAVERLFEVLDQADAAVALPLAQRAARALLREARATAASIVAEAERQASRHELHRE